MGTWEQGGMEAGMEGENEGRIKAMKGRRGNNPMEEGKK